MAERFKIIPSVFLIFIQDGKVLLGRRQNTGWEDGNYGLPAGHGEEGETMKEGAAREALEETGVTVAVEDLQFALTMHRFCGDHSRADFYFIPTKWSGTPRNTEPHLCDDLSWFSLDALPPNTIPHIRAALESYKKGKGYCEFDWEKRLNEQG